MVLLILICTAREACCAEDRVTSVPEMSVSRGYIEPFKLFDNLYYVGDKWVSAFLLNTEAGLVLIDSLEFSYSMWLPTNIKNAGFSVADIKRIVITHGYSDHAGGARANCCKKQSTALRPTIILLMPMVLCSF